MADSTFLWGAFPLRKQQNISLWGSMPIGGQYVSPPPVYQGASSLSVFFEIVPSFAKVNLMPFENKVKLSEVLDVKQVEPKQLWQQELSTEKQGFLLDEKQRIMIAIEKFQDLIGAMDEMKELLAKKLANRKVVVDRKKKPQVIESIRRLFGEDTNVITFEMFKKALEIRSKVLAESRRRLNYIRQTSNQTNKET